ncbi:MAG: ATP-binding protein [Myxococcota bacterium]
MTFEMHTVPSDTPALLREHLSRSQPIALVGMPGTGRSTALQQAVNGSPVLRVSLGNSPARTVLAMRQAAATVGADLLRTFADQGVEAALAELDARVGDGLVVIDDADALLLHTPDRDEWTDAVPGMVAPIDATWVEWLRRRRGASILVGHRCALDGFATVRHTLNPKRGEEWPITLRHADGGVREWPTLARKLSSRLDLFYFARAVAPTMSADAFNDLVKNADLSEILPVFGRMFRAGAGRWVRALDVIHTLDGAAESVVRCALLRGGVAWDAESDSWLEGAPDLLTLLCNEHLITISGPDNGRDGVVRPIAALVENGAVERLSSSRCGELARALVRTVNDPRTLDPDGAAVVLAAHDLAVRAGHVDLALQTAQLHVQGLIELARRLSVDQGDYSGAWRLYDRTESLVPLRDEQKDRGQARVRSYILNYRAYNGQRAGELDAAAALSDATEAVFLWPENARWHRHKIELLFALGRGSDALTAVHDAESRVAPHPQRARHLRVYPARTALRGGDIRSALALLELGSPQWVSDEEARTVVRSIIQTCERGVEIRELASTAARINFHSTLRCSLTRLTADGKSSWMARLDAIHATATEREPMRALDALVDAVAGETVRLVSNPTPWLTDGDAVRKGELLSAVDVLNSDIGLDFATERWFVGRIEGTELQVMDARVGQSLEIATGVAPVGSATGLWFGRAPVDRAGFPSGPVNELRPAGSGRTLTELREELERLWGVAS